MARKGSKRSQRAKLPDAQPAKKPDSQAGASAISTQQASDPWRPWLLAGAVGLLVARPLYPSETPADTGDGLPIVMLWLALAVVWMLGLLGRRRFTVRFGLLDGLVMFLVLWHVGSALLGASRSHARPAVNMLWEWVGLGLVFLLVRQWVAGQKEIRAIVTVMLALAVALAGYGLFQCLYEFPQTRAAYQMDPEKALREAGFYYPPGSPERIAFEKRLESREPIAAFALTNSLAGFLTPWLVAAVGIGLLGGGWSAGWRPRGGLLGGCLLMAACLLLTKSRSAYLAVLAGLGSIGFWWLWVQLQGLRRTAIPTGQGLQHQPMPDTRSIWRRTALGGIVLLILVGCLIAASWYWGGLDIQVLTEAQKSLQYRLEYWQATWQIIRQDPLWGCGPGLFRYAYTRFKQPQASEEIADPHNFLLEIWATAGTPAALAMLVFLVLWAVQVVRISRAKDLARLPPTVGNSNQTRADPAGSAGKVLVGAAAGAAVGFWVGQWSDAPPSLYVLIIGLPLGMATVWALWPWVQASRSPPVGDGLGTGRVANAAEKAQNAVGSCEGSGSSPPHPACFADPPLPQRREGIKGAGEGDGPPHPNPLQRRGEGIGSSPKAHASPPHAHSSFSHTHPGFGQAEMLPGVLAAAAGALLVNLFAAGGISFAGVAGSLWLLAALATRCPLPVPPRQTNPAPSEKSSASSGPSEVEKVKQQPAESESPTESTTAESADHSPQGEPDRGVGNRRWLAWLDREHQVGWPGAAGGVIATMAVFFACHQTAFSPVLGCQSLLQQALRAAGTDPMRAEKLLQQAASIDPFSALPAEWLSAVAFQQWQERFQERPNEPGHWMPRLHQFEQYALLALELNPEDAPAWFIQGERFLTIGGLLLDKSPQQARRAFHRALGCFQQAASLYPNNALYRARLAETFAALGYQPGMIREAQAALWLDDLMPHAEKKLPEPLRRQLARMQAGLYNTKTEPP